MELKSIFTMDLKKKKNMTKLGKIIILNIVIMITVNVRMNIISKDIKMDKKRIKYRLCKGLGILMVTWGHITKLDNPVDTWAASFKMAIFFVAAGYLIRYADSYRTQTLKGYSVKLLKSLMLSYVLFSILSIGFRFATMIMKHRIDIPAIKSYILATITLRGTFALWFLPVLFIAEILFFCLIKYLRNDEDRDIDRDTCFWNLGVLFYQTLDRFSGSINI